ncbi:MAG: histidinol dehydrogenase [Bowdeniella nasicola]|nr:histidinol dehydrogenase [Bowdeniella nasicola]
MLQLLDLRGQNLTANLAERLPRASHDVADVLPAVTALINEVRTRGTTALRDHAERFDGVRPPHLRVPASALPQAADQLDPVVRKALELAIDHAQRGHEAQLPQEVTTHIIPGGTIRQRWIPVDRVGLYAPGGLAAYPSSVVMNAVAAQVAGVQQIALASPPQRDHGGLPHPAVLAACYLLGIDEVYAVGGADAIGMFAYGVADEDGAPMCPRVDVVTGPGNVYVAAAKRAVAGVCGIDAEAGTTEIAIIADDTAEPAYVAADLISQAEHDPAAASVLITASEALVDAVVAQVEEQCMQATHRERITQALSGPQSGIVLVDDAATAIDVANAYAAEHLEIHTADAPAVAARIRHAGAIFVGPYTPVPLGDYVAGSNHVLPTGGTARYRAGLSVMPYIRPVQQVEYSREALAAVSEPLAALALTEGLPAHARAASIRSEH